MTRHPVSFICPVPKSRTKCPDTERFFTKDLAAYLRVPVAKVAYFVKKRGLVRHVRVVRRRFVEQEVPWVTRSGARIVLEHFRALQGQWALRGRDWYADEARKRATRKRGRERALSKCPPVPKPPRLEGSPFSVPWRSGKSFPGHRMG